MTPQLGNLGNMNPLPALENLENMTPPPPGNHETHKCQPPCCVKSQKEDSLTGRRTKSETCGFGGISVSVLPREKELFLFWGIYFNKKQAGDNLSVQLLLDQDIKALTPLWL